ncbi:hypothetical protein DYB30_011353, partial [Aphanomyces astaci]
KKRSSLLSLTRRNVAIQSWIRDQEANRQANKAYRAAAQANDVAHQRRVALAEAQQDEFERWVHSARPTNGSSRWPDIVTFSGGMRLSRFQAYTFDPAEMHDTWAWEFFSAQMRLKKAPNWVGPMYELGPGGDP